MFCPSCGTEVSNDMSFCPKCGCKVGNTGNNTYNSAPNYQQNSSGFTADDINKNKGISILSYFGLLFLIPLLCEPSKNSPFARFHVNQGIVLFITNMILGVISRIPFVGVIGWLGLVGTFVLFILGIINCVNGEAKPLPVIGEIKILN